MWTTYKRGRMDLATVALASDKAFVIFQRAGMELMAGLKSVVLSDIQDQVLGSGVIKYLSMFASLQRGQEPFATYPYNQNLWDVADWLCLPVYIIL